MLKTIEEASPGPHYVTIVQGPGEPFLLFAEKLAAALERQIENVAVREILCKQLARFNSNSECQRIIAALPGDPSVAEMAIACVTTGDVDHRASTLAVASQPGQVALGGGQRKKKKTKGKKQQGAPKPAGTDFLCARCQRAGHLANQCSSQFDANGQPLAGLGNGKQSAQGNCTLTKVISQSTAPAQVCPAGSETSPTALPAWMYVLQPQSS